MTTDVLNETENQIAEPCNQVGKTENSVATIIDQAEEFDDPLDGLVEKSSTEPGEAFKPEVLERLKELRQHNQADYETLRARLREAGCRVGELDKALKSLLPNIEQENDLGLFEPEPWPEEVDGDDLLDQIQRAILSHVVTSRVWCSTCCCVPFSVREGAHRPTSVLMKICRRVSAVSCWRRSLGWG